MLTHTRTHNDMYTCTFLIKEILLLIKHFIDNSYNSFTSTCQIPNTIDSEIIIVCV